MLLRMSTLLLRTLREDPADAEVPSHRLLLRAGYIRRAAPGGYTWLPLGKLVLDRITEVVRERDGRDRRPGGALPGAAAARSRTETSGRWTEYGDDIFTARGPARRRAPAGARPTRRCSRCWCKDLFTSYRDFPVMLFQVQTKFRDEARPRAGLLRGREFLMKDAYSFDLDDGGAAATRTPGTAPRTSGSSTGSGLDYTVVHAMSGAMGGSASEEFLAADAGRRGHLRRLHRLRLRGEHRGGGHPGAGRRRPGRAAGRRRCTTPRTPRPSPAWSSWPTPRRLGGRADWTAADTLKNVVLTVRQPGAERAELLVIGCPATGRST